jgi:hypothetical protein
VYSGIATDRDIEERRQSIAMEKRCNNELRMKANGLDVVEERGIRQPAIPATVTVMAMAMATGGKHWVAGGVASGGSGNGILL